MLSRPRIIPRKKASFRLGCLRLRLCLLRGTPELQILLLTNIMFILEILTGQRPFHDLNDMAVMFHILEGKHPPRPMSCSDSLWELLQNCWVGNTEIRPTAPQIVKRLEGPSIRATTTSSTTDWDNKFTSKFRRSLQTRPLLPSVTQIERMLFSNG
jgi:serine/threonine protein kinase